MATKQVYYADETEHGVKAGTLGINLTNKIFVFGGFSIPYDNILLLKEKVRKVKFKYAIPEELPLKWNIKDLKSIYLKSVGVLKYNEIVQKSDEIRIDVLKEIAKPELDLKILVSCSHKDLVPKKERNFHTECFSNYLQRVGLDLKYAPIEDALVIIDTQAKENECVIADEFTTAYYHGKDTCGNVYKSGNLSQYNIFPSLLFASDLHSCEIQIADILVGLVKEFMKWVSGSYNPRTEELVKKCFPLIIHNFRTYQGRIFGYGLIVPKSRLPRFPKFISKLNEIKALARTNEPNS